MRTFKISIAIVALLIVTAMPASANTTLGKSEVTPSSLVESEKGLLLTKRLEEINAMDKVNMKRSEKRQLRREVNAINKELKELGGGGVYLSVGAIIIIILLLIILL